jgi:hypothetical protein
LSALTIDIKHCSRVANLDQPHAFTRPLPHSQGLRRTTVYDNHGTPAKDTCQLNVSRKRA